MTFIPRMTRTALWSFVWLWFASALAGYAIGRLIDGRHAGAAATLLSLVGLFVGPVCLAAVRTMDADKYRMEGAVRESREADVRKIQEHQSEADH